MSAWDLGIFQILSIFTSQKIKSIVTLLVPINSINVSLSGDSIRNRFLKYFRVECVHEGHISPLIFLLYQLS